MAVRFSLPEWERQKLVKGLMSYRRRKPWEGYLTSPLKHKWIFIQPSVVRKVIRVLAI